MDANRDERTLRGVKIWEVDERGRLLRSIRADRVVIQPDGEWRFHNSRIDRMDPANILTPPVFEQLPGEAAIELTDTTDAALMNADAAALPLYELRQYVQARRQEGDPAVHLETVFHRRLTDPLAVVIFVLLAIPLGLQVDRARSIGLPALEGIGTLALFFLLRNTGGALALEGVLLPGTLPWTVIGLFTAWAAWRFHRLAS
jgi:lipopolysaccharide export LptBFGC system permease protein LptF